MAILRTCRNFTRDCDITQPTLRLQESSALQLSAETPNTRRPKESPYLGCCDCSFLQLTMERRLLLCVLLVAALCKGDHSLTAVFNTGGIRGTIEFSQEAVNQRVNIHVSLVGGQPKEVFRWAVYRLPARYDTAEPCAKRWIGTMLSDYSERIGLLAAEQEMQFFDPELELFHGPDAIAGRTLVLYGIQTGRVACASLSPGEPPTTYVARFYGPVAGLVYVRQCIRYSSVYSHLYWVNGTRKDMQVRWDIELGNDEQSHVQQQIIFPGDLPSEPFYEKGQALTVGKAPNLDSGMSYHNLKGLPTLDSITKSMHIILRDTANATLSVGVLKPLGPKHAVANFGFNYGEAVFHQSSPFEQTLVIVKLDHLRFGVSNFCISKVSLNHRDKRCPLLSTVFDPLELDTIGALPAKLGTPDQYRVGDLSGKYGLLLGKDNTYYRVLDPTLPLYGPNSVVGRVLTIYRTDGAPLVCVNIIPVGKRLVTGRVAFNSPVLGDLILTQAADDPDDETYVTAELCWSDHTVGETVDHNWHVHGHELPNLVRGFSTTQCQPAGGHYDPHQVDGKETYFAHCDRWAPYRCQAGDLSARLGTFSIPPCGRGAAKYHFVAGNVALSGPYSIIGRSVVIHHENYAGQRLICGNIDSL